MKFELGRTADGAIAKLDTDVLIETRMLIQANSGGGKSWAIRRILEKTYGHVQHLVLDPEGEFKTLRERHDYVLVGKGGDVAISPRHAGRLARTLLELGVSAILDIYELKRHERVEFVDRFLKALVDAPRSLWHPCLVVVDEAHVYCPEGGRAGSGEAIIDLTTRGRKRGVLVVNTCAERAYVILRNSENVIVADSGPKISDIGPARS